MSMLGGAALLCVRDGADIDREPIPALFQAQIADTIERGEHRREEKP